MTTLANVAVSLDSVLGLCLGSRARQGGIINDYTVSLACALARTARQVGIINDDFSQFGCVLRLCPRLVPWLASRARRGGESSMMTLANLAVPSDYVLGLCLGSRTRQVRDHFLTRRRFCFFGGGEPAAPQPGGLGVEGGGHGARNTPLKFKRSFIYFCRMTGAHIILQYR